MTTRLIEYHEMHAWKLWPRIQYGKFGTVYLLELLFGRYGFQIWHSKKYK